MSIDRCKDYDKPVKDGYKATLYHGTADIVGVCDRGLLTQKELYESECRCDSRKCGLGGSNDGLISFISDKNLAIVIADEIKNLMDIADGVYDWETIDTLVDNDRLWNKDASASHKEEFCKDSLQKGSWLWDKIVKRAQEGDRDLILRPNWLPSGQEWSDYLAGWYKEGSRNQQNPLKEIEEKVKEDYKRMFGTDRNVKCRPYPYYSDSELDKWRKEDQKKDKHAFVQCYEPEKVKEELFDFYRHHYLRFRWAYGGKPDPVFFGSQYIDFKGRDSDRTGVVKVSAYLPQPLEVLENAKRKARKVQNEYQLDAETRHILYEYNYYPEKYGFKMCSSMDEYRVARDRFNELEVIYGNTDLL